jgi:membrane protein insertase Oxa1/YidC/SpoIIIJ
MLAPVELAQHLLTFLETATRPLLGAESAWFAIVLLTVLVRVVLLPLAVVQARAARAQLGLQPEIAALRKRHALLAAPRRGRLPGRRQPLHARPADPAAGPLRT